MTHDKISIFGKSFKVTHLILLIMMILIAFVMIAPFLWVFSASVRIYSDAISLPPKWLPPVITNWDTAYFSKLFRYPVF